MVQTAYPTPSQLLATYLDALRYAYYVYSGGLTVETGVGSDCYNRGVAITQRVAQAIANNQISLAQSNPLTATGDDLIALAAVFGVAPRPASNASGGITITCSGTVTIPPNFTGTIGAQRYTTGATGGGTFATGASVPVTCISGGPGGDAQAGAIFTWDSAAIGALARTGVVDGSGITDGYAADGNDQLRASLLQRLAAAPVGGNWPMVVEVAENATAAVEAAYCYAANGGAGSFAVACTQAGPVRTLNTPTLNVVRGALAAAFPGQERITVNSCTIQPTDVVAALTLPLPLGAGNGGGWRDQAPWPAEDVYVTGIAFGVTIQTHSLAGSQVSAPVVGTSIGIWDPTTLDTSVTPHVMGTMREFNIATVLGSWPNFSITVQGAYPAWLTTIVNAGCRVYISAGAINLVSYARNVAAQVQKLGPGEITALPELLPLASRQPAADITNGVPSGVTTKMLGILANSYAEIEDFSLSQVNLAGTSTAQSTPQIPDTTGDPPLVITLAGAVPATGLSGSLAFRQL
jgi:uncharacterized phage protein gp47/JayE